MTISNQSQHSICTTWPFNFNIFSVVPVTSDWLENGHNIFFSFSRAFKRSPIAYSLYEKWQNFGSIFSFGPGFNNFAKNQNVLNSVIFVCHRCSFIISWYAEEDVAILQFIWSHWNDWKIIWNYSLWKLLLSDVDWL